jgi:membrane protein required for colicin V production
MFGAYLVFSFLSFGFARLLHGWMERNKMTEYNSHLGAVFGLLKGVAFCLVLTFFIVTLSDDAREMLRHSRSGKAAAIIMDRLHPVMPEKLHAALEKYIHQLDDPQLDLRHAQDPGHSNLTHSHGGQSPGTSSVVPPGSQNPLGGAADPFEAVPNPFASIPPGGTHSAGVSSRAVIDAIVAKLPLWSQDQTRMIVEQAIQRTPAEQRTQLLSELQAAAPETVLGLATDWLSRRFTSPSSPPPAASERDQLLGDIAARYWKTPQERTTGQQQILSTLQGLPDAILLGVLRDWQADLAGASVDPDPETDASTKVDNRIIRQLTIQRVSVFQLSQSLQDRLRRAAQR